jgi:polar amino acid transport system permease protein
MSQLEILGGILSVLTGGAATALKVALGAFAIALAGGVVLAVVRTFIRFKLLNVAIAIYIEWMRNVPALAHLFVIYFGLAALGIRLSPLVAAILGLGLVGAAVLCDIFVAGLKSIHIGQREAALSAGMTPAQTLVHILLPQMLRVTWPSLGNYTSQLIKDTSIASAIAAPEIMFFARNLVTSTFETTLIYIAAMLLYAAMVLPISWAFAKTESRMESQR